MRSITAVALLAAPASAAWFDGSADIDRPGTAYTTLTLPVGDGTRECESLQ
eukprot:COSAG01_NODE_69185_length_262_cov_0.625767_1_plen_50_part_01